MVLCMVVLGGMGNVGGVVLGALEESVWPQATEPGPWMSRPMRAAFGFRVGYS